MAEGRAGDFALLGLLALLWGSSYLFIKVAVAEVPPLTLIAARVAIAAAILSLILAARGEAWPCGRAMWARLLLQAVFNSIGAWTLLAWGQQYVDAGLAAVLNSTAPVFVFLIALLITRHESVSPVRLVGALLGVAGVALIVGVEALSGLGAALWGQLAALGGAALYACAAIYGRRFGAISPTAAAAGTMVWATAALVPAALIVDRPWRLAPSAEALGATATLGVFCTAWALMIYFRLLRRIGPMATASQAYLRAGVGVALGVALLGETMTPTVAAGLVAALAGVALINRRPA